jgi:hypothetical protein
MRKSSGRKSGGLALLLLAGVGSAAYYAAPSDWIAQLGQAGGHVGAVSTAGAQQLSSTTLATSLPALEATQRPASQSSASGSRVFSPTTPLIEPGEAASKAPVRLAQAPGQSGPTQLAARSDTATTTRPSSTIGFVAPSSADGSRRLASSKPADDDARRELTRDLQKELKRVGCFDGEVNGTWTPASKKAMSAFMDRVNATLPVEDPDYILLTLVQGHDAQACGKGCPPGQGLANDGRCVPRAILAQTARKTDDRKLADRIETRPAAEPKITEAKPSDAPLQTGSISKPQSPATGGWTTSTIASAEPPKPSVPPTAAPMPGRMAMGAPVPTPDETAKLDDIEARKKRAQAALIEEQKLQAKAQAESERLKAERQKAELVAEADRRERQAKAQAENDRLKAERLNVEAERREKQVAAADARRSAQRQAEALEGAAKAEPEKSTADANGSDAKASDAAKVAAVAAAAVVAQEANERRIVARRAREAREREQDRAERDRERDRERERERRLAAAAPPPQVNVRRPSPPPQIYRPTVARAPAPTPRPVPEQRWTRTIFSDITRSR